MTDEERVEVASELRKLAAVTAYVHLPDSNLASLLFSAIHNGTEWDVSDRNPDGLFLNRLADLIELEERTCYVEHIDDDSFHLSCGHEADGYISPNYCPACGAKVVDEDA